MQYCFILFLALFGSAQAAFIPAEHRLETVAESSCTNGHGNASESAMNHGHKHHNKSTAATPQSAITPPAAAQSPSTIPATLVPAFGITPGIDPQHGNCKGLNEILIPCSCPPSRDAFIAKMAEFVAAGNAEGTPVSFPTDNSLTSQITRLSTSIVTLQNFNGRPGSGCPASSTTFVGQRAKLLALL